jgi:cell division septum initiation protein DivIVA
VTDVTQSLKDAAYVAVGFSVIGFQKAQVRRQEVNRQLRGQRQQLETQLSGAREQVAGLVKGLEGAVQPVRQQIEGSLDRIEERLPGQAKDLVRGARSLAKGTEDQVRNLMGA